MTKKYSENRLRPIPKKLYLSKEEEGLIIDKAKIAKMDFSKYVRMMALEGEIIVKNFSGLSEINKIGVNINQIAKMINTNKTANQDEYMILLDEYKKLLDLYYALILQNDSDDE